MTLEPTQPPATKGQRLALLAGLVLAAWAMLQLFASVLLPFVAAAGIAYFLDPLARQLARLGLRRSVGAGVLIFGLLLFILLFALLLYPLLLAQVGILVTRVPVYVQLIRAFAGTAKSARPARRGFRG